MLTLAFASPVAAQFTLINNSGQASATTSFPPGSFIDPQTVQTSFGPNGGFASADIDVGPFGRMRGVQTGYGLNAVAVDAHRLSDLQSFDWQATANYQSISEPHRVLRQSSTSSTI